MPPLPGRLTTSKSSSPPYHSADRSTSVTASET